MRPFEFQCQDCGAVVIDWLERQPSGAHYHRHANRRYSHGNGEELTCNGVLARRYSFGVGRVEGAGGSKAKPSP